MSDHKSIKISDISYEELESYIENTEFDSVDEYLQFVIEALLHGLDQEVMPEGDMDSPDEELEDRLKSLGYLE